MGWESISESKGCRGETVLSSDFIGAGIHSFSLHTEKSIRRKCHPIMTAQSIKQTREALGLSQTELASLLGVHSQTISNWERSTHIPTEWQSRILDVISNVKGEYSPILKAWGRIRALSHLLSLGLKTSLQNVESKNKT